MEIKVIGFNKNYTFIIMANFGDPSVVVARVSKTLDFETKKQFTILIDKLLNKIVDHKRSLLESGIKNIKIFESKTIGILSKLEYKILYTKNELKLSKLQKIKKSINKKLIKFTKSIEEMILTNFKELDQISQEVSSFFYKTDYTDIEIANLNSLLLIDIGVSEIKIFKDIDDVINAFGNFITNFFICYFPFTSFEFLEKELGIIEEGHKSNITCTEISNSCEFFLTGSTDCTIRLWDLTTMTHKFAFYEHKGPVTALAITKNDEFAISASNDNSIILWNIEKRSLIKRKIVQVFSITTIELSYDDKYFFTLSNYNVLKYWDFASLGETDSFIVSNKAQCFTLFYEKHSIIVWEPGVILYKDFLDPSQNDSFIILNQGIVTTLKVSSNNNFILIVYHQKIVRLFKSGYRWNFIISYDHDRKINDLAIASNDEFFLTVSDDCRLRLWSLINNKCERVFKKCSSPLLRLKISQDDKLAITLSFSNELRIWNINLEICESSFQCDGNLSKNVRLAKNSKFLIIGCSDGSLNICDIVKRSIDKLINTNMKAHCICFSQDKSLAATGSADKCVFVWNLNKRKIITEYKEHNGTITCLDIKENNAYVASGSEDNTIIIWDIITQKLIARLKVKNGFIKCIKFIPNSNFIVSGSSNTIIMWDLLKKKSKCIIEGHTEDVEKIEGINNFIASSSKYEILIWDTNENAIKYKIPIFGVLKILAINRNCSMSAFVTSRNKLALYNIKLKTQVLPLNNFSIPKCAVITENMDLIMPDDKDFTLIVYDIINNKEKSTLKGHKSGINSIVLMADELRLASGSADMTIIIWNLIAFTQLSILSGHLLDINTLFLTKDNVYIASGSLDSTVRLWNIESKILVFEKSFESCVKSLVMTSDNRLLFVGLKNTEVKTYDFEYGTIKLLTSFDSSVEKVSVTSNDKYAVFISSGSCLKVWNIAKENIDAIFTSKDNLLNSFIICKNDVYIPSISGIGILKLKNMFRNKYTGCKQNIIPNELKENEFTNDVLDDCIEMYDVSTLQKIAKENRELLEFLSHYFYLKK